MTITQTGRAEVSRYIAQVPKQMVRLLGGAARAGGNVIAEDAKARTRSERVAASIKVRTKREADRIVAYIETRGPGAYLAPWEEYGTAPHFISVDDSQRGGRGIKRINQLVKAAGDGEASLVIGGDFVGKTVWHPGARPGPFLRPALDMKGDEALQAAQNYITARVGRSGIAAPSDEDDA